MNFLLSARKDKDGKHPNHFLCRYCKQVFNDQCALGIHVRMNHSNEVKSENSRRALSRSGSSFNARSTVLALRSEPIGCSTRARISRRTLTKGSSSLDFSMSLPSAGNSPKNSSSLPENHQEPFESMPSMFQNHSSVSSISSSSSSSNIGPSSQSWTSFAASSGHHGSAAGDFHRDPSSSLRPADITSYHPGNSSDSFQGMPSFKSVNLPNPPTYNLGYLPHLAPAVTEPYPGLRPNLPDMSKEFIPLGLRQSTSPLDEFEAVLARVKCPTHHNSNQGKNTCKDSTLKTSDFMGSSDRPSTSCSHHPCKPKCSYPTEEFSFDLHGQGSSSTSGKEEDGGDLDLSLHL